MLWRQGKDTADDASVQLIAQNKDGGSVASSLLVESDDGITMNAAAARTRAAVNLIHSTDFMVYSDSYTTLKASIDGATGNIMTVGKVSIGTASPSAYADLTLEGGALCLKETTTPTANANYAKIYSKNDNKLYLQDGAGTEHEVSLVA